MTLLSLFPSMYSSSCSTCKESGGKGEDKLKLYFVSTVNYADLYSLRMAGHAARKANGAVINLLGQQKAFCSYFSNYLLLLIKLLEMLCTVGERGRTAARIKDVN